MEFLRKLWFMCSGKIVLTQSTQPLPLSPGILPQSNSRGEMQVVKKFWAKSLAKAKTTNIPVPTCHH